MNDKAAEVVQGPASSEFVTDLVASIEKEAQQGSCSLAKQCQKLLQVLQVGDAFDQRKPETPSIRLELVRGDNAARATSTSYGAATALTALTARNTIEDAAAVLAAASRSRDVRSLLNTVFPGRVESLSRKLFLTLREASDYSGLPLASIRRLVKRNELPAIKAGGWLVKRAHLERLELRHLRRLARPPAS